MKSSITITDTLGIFAVILMTVLIFTQILPMILSTLIDSFSKSSAENVARQLSNLITVSGSAPHKAEINYIPTRDVVYKISINSRTIKVTPKFEVSYAEKSSSTQSFAVNLGDSEHEDVNSFLVEKNFLNGESKYAFHAKKE